MQVWHAIILGVIEGITEFLPISSTGHLTIAEKTLLAILVLQHLLQLFKVVQFWRLWSIFGKIFRGF